MKQTQLVLVLELELDDPHHPCSDHPLVAPLLSQFHLDCVV